MANKVADLAGPGVSTYPEVERILPNDYRSLLTKKETQKAIFAVKDYIEENLCKELNLMMVTVPLIVDDESGVNDMLDRDGSRTPVQFHSPTTAALHPRSNAQVVQAATKWKRVALKQFGMQPGEGICTDMRAVRKDYFLDHDHSSYVDQWDWERVITAEERNLAFLKDIVRKIWKVLTGAENHVQELFPQLKDPQFPEPARGTDFPARRRDPGNVPGPAAQAARDGTSCRSIPAVFIIGIGWTLAGRLPARNARRRLRRLGHRDSHGRADDARTERRHPGLEPRHPAPPRADFDGHPRDQETL